MSNTYRCPHCGKFTADGDIIYDEKFPEGICVDCWTKHYSYRWDQSTMKYRDKDGEEL